MALRARRRQGGSPNRRGTQTIGTVVSRPGQGAALGGLGAAAKSPLSPTTTKGTPVASKPVVRTPQATYQQAAPLKPPGPIAPMPSSTSAQMRTGAESAWGRAQTENRDAIFRAVMNLGDPTQFAKYQANPEFAGYQFTQDPNSLFATLARQEKQGLEDVDTAANVGNTFFSGKRLADRQNLTDETNRQRLAGSTGFEDDLKAFASALGAQRDAYRQTMSDADQMDIDAALEQERIARQEWQDQIDAARALGPQKGTGAVLPTPTGPPSAQRQAQAAQFKARQDHEEALRRAKKKKK